jgi:hypothetical protein
VGSPAAGSTYDVLSDSSSLLGTFSVLVGPYTVSYSSSAVTVQATA